MSDRIANGTVWLKDTFGGVYRPWVPLLISMLGKVMCTNYVCSLSFNL